MAAQPGQGPPRQRCQGATVRVQQCTLMSGPTITTGWLEAGRVKVTDRLTLKGDQRVWTVMRVDEPTVEQSDLNRAWNVGGIEGSR